MPPWMDGSEFLAARWMFLRALGVVAAVAFLSLLWQVKGLFGSGGILPVSEYLDALRPLGRRRFIRCPTLLWLGAGDRALWVVAGLGVVASAALAAGLTALPALAVIWACYLSLVAVGRDFLAFQWDVMLVEVVVLAFLLTLASPPPDLAVALLWVFVFRFYFSSGAVKLLSGDPTWWTLRALDHHYETQPLPTRLAWRAHRLPAPLQRASVAGMFLVELAVPFLVLGPPPTRLTAVALLALFQLAILATGNYGFFNLLSMVILIPLIPDPLWGGLGPGTATVGLTPAWSHHLAVVLAGGLLVLNLARLATLFGRPRWATGLLRPLSGWRLVNPYGLFAVMTTVRYEILVEGSRDGDVWHRYEFRWKPGDPTRPPRWNAPHQPRLDWQLWFAALDGVEEHAWFLRFLKRLLEGTPEVSRLLAEDPFAEGPPRYVRAVRAVYRFSDRTTRRRRGVWWSPREIGTYVPPLTLREGWGGGGS